MAQTFTRKEFHELVWSKPLTQLAKEFALSDVALHKICKKHNIPHPPLGWWAKKHAGQTVKIAPLPKAKAGMGGAVTIAGGDLSRETASLAAVRENARILAASEPEPASSNPIIANLTTYWTAMKANGCRRLLLWSVDPLGTTNSASFDFKQRRNRAYADWARRNSDEIVFIDCTVFLLDGNATSFNPIGGGSQVFGCVMNDSGALHCSAFGCERKGAALEPLLARYYPAAFLRIPSFATEAYNATTNKHGNLVTGARFRTNGGTDSLALVGGATKSGTPPAGWTHGGTLQDGLALTWSVVDCAGANAALRRGTINPIKAVKLTLVGTPAAAGNLGISKSGPVVNIPSGIPMRRDFAVYINKMAGVFAINQTMGGSPDPTVVGGGTGDFDCQPYVIPGLYMFRKDYISATYVSENFSLGFTYRAGVPVDWDIDLLAVGAYRTD